MTNELYPDLGNQFPAREDTIDKWLDPTIETLSDIQKYYEKINAGDIEGANHIITLNPILKRMMINAESLNFLRDAIISLERFYLSDVKQYLVEIVKYRQEYSPSAKYAKYDVVYYTVNGASQAYMCIQDNTPAGTLPTNINYFISLTLRGEQGASGVGLSPRGTWDSSTLYYENDMVAHQNALWGSKTQNLNKTPHAASADWFLLMEFSADLMTYDNLKSALRSHNMQDAITELDSNMRKTYVVDLPASGWVGITAPYTQIVSISDITDTDEPIADLILKDTDTPAQVEVKKDTFSLIDRITTRDGAVKAYCYDEKPASHIQIRLKGV